MNQAYIKTNLNIQLCPSSLSVIFACLHAGQVILDDPVDDCFTKYRAESFTNTDSDTDTNAYRHMVAIISHLLLYKYIYKVFKCVLIRYGFLATTKPTKLITY